MGLWSFLLPVSANFAFQKFCEVRYAKGGGHEAPLPSRVLMPLGARGTLGTYSGSDATLKAPFGKILGELCAGDEAVEHPLTANHDVGPVDVRDVRPGAAHN